MGSTGSVGVQTLQLVREAPPGLFVVDSLAAAGSRVHELFEQCLDFW